LLEKMRPGARPAEAADELARTVEHILRRLRRGQTVELPGIGRLVPDVRAGLSLAPKREARHGRH